MCILDAMSEDDQAELMTLREFVREHWALLSAQGKDPLEGLTWSPDIDRFDALLHSVATRGGLDAPPLPWTNVQRMEIDEQCRSTGLLDGHPLLPG
jgi:hypothetical protein